MSAAHGRTPSARKRPHSQTHGVSDAPKKRRGKGGHHRCNVTRQTAPTASRTDEIPDRDWHSKFRTEAKRWFGEKLPTARRTTSTDFDITLGDGRNKATVNVLRMNVEKRTALLDNEKTPVETGYEPSPSEFQREVLLTDTRGLCFATLRNPRRSPEWNVTPLTNPTTEATARRRGRCRAWPLPNLRSGDHLRVNGGLACLSIRSEKRSAKLRLSKTNAFTIR